MSTLSINWSTMVARGICVRLSVSFLAACVLLIVSAPVQASPGWEVTSNAYPTNLPSGGTGNLDVYLYNVGSTRSNGPITITDTLPAGVTVTSAGNTVIRLNEELEEEELPAWECSGLGTSVLTCTSIPANLPAIPIQSSEIAPGGGPVQVGIIVKVPAGMEGTFENHVTVSGGGAPGVASVSNPITLSAAPVSSFGLEGFDGWFSSADGTTDTQAGSHPYAVTFSYQLKTHVEKQGTSSVLATAGGLDRTVDVNLPPGVVGDPNAVPQCTREQLDHEKCPVSTQIGVDRVAFVLSLVHHGLVPYTVPFSVFNMVPPPGVPAQFAFELSGFPVYLDAGIRSGGDYGISEHIDDIPQQPAPIANTITLWGEPSDPSHDIERFARLGVCETGCSSSAARKPFLTLPTSCEGPVKYGQIVRSWEGFGEDSFEFFSHDSAHTPVGFTGCDHLGFKPSISVAPDTSAADTPAGLTVDVRVPQEGLGQPGGLATSNIKNTTVTLPKGVVINPGQAAGLQACQASQDGVGTEGPPSCPSASHVGTDEIETPLLTKPLKGDVYVLQANPPDLKLLIAASGAGVYLKLVANVHLDEATGQLTTTLEKTPELPFTDFKLSFSGGAQAALDTPTGCGVYSTVADFTPWSTPFVPDAFPASNFSIDTGPSGSACASPLPFTPNMIAGATTDQAGGFTNFSLLLQRPDDQQRVSGLQFKTPEGLLGMISKVPLCPEPQAAAGTCSSASQIGHTVVEAGPGPYPLVVPQPGQPPAPIYLTGPYKGAPYGLSIVVPLVVGPFTLQTQVVRAKIEVDRLTARLTVTTDPLPTIIDGIPADLRAINAVVDRPEFMFNPTSCAPQSFTGTATSTEGTTAPLDSHFQMGSCQSLKFSPNFKVSTSGKTSRKNGASLEAKIVYPVAPVANNQASTQSNIKSVKVNLPKQLPSRLTTLQKACPAATFETNPAGCPAGSKVGTATATTPVLPVQLSGPAYFVSYGGAKFPELVIVLQGYGVTVDLHGETFISKAGITSSTFRQVPDVPVTVFDLKLPQGPGSALAANGNLCKSKLKMPTAFTGQNGAVIHQTTPIAVTGCPKAKKARRAGHAGGKVNKRKK